MLKKDRGCLTLRLAASFRVGRWCCMVGQKCPMLILAIFLSQCLSFGLSLFG